MFTPSRRALLLASASLLARPAGAKGRAKQAKHLLILGGTGFLGPAIVNAALARGHRLTLFNRGKTRPELFRGKERVEILQGDRDPKKEAGLAALEGKAFDAAIDTSGYYPRMVSASAGLLSKSLGHYVFISSVSAYARYDVPDMDESAPTATLADPNVEEMGKDFENYGGLKRACEVAAEAAMPGKTTSVRAGYIVGREDRSDRFTYWPVRYDRGGTMLAPGSPADPLQIIDVRDLAEWLVRVVEDGTMGVFNAAGPGTAWTMGGLFDACRKATGKKTPLTWVPSDFLVAQQENGDGAIPIWNPPTGKYGGMHRMSSAKAIRAGLRFRDPVDTVKDTLAWWKSLPEERRAKPKAFLPPEREAELLKLWAQAQAGGRDGG